MTIKLNESKLRDCQKTVHELMVSPSNDSGFYNERTHNFLKKEELDDETFSREVMLPLDEEYWPEAFAELKRAYDGNLSWPKYALHQYVSDMVYSPIPTNYLYFGYALLENRLVKTPFLAVTVMVSMDIDGSEVETPIKFAIDPFASFNGIQPDCYIGANVPGKYIMEWFKAREQDAIHPLENFVREFC